MATATKNFRVFNTLGQGWKNVKGSKGAIMVTLIVAGLINAIVGMILSFTFIATGLVNTSAQAQTAAALAQKGGVNIHDAVANIINNIDSTQFLIHALVQNIVLAPFFGGIYWVAINRARGQSVTTSTGFQCFRRWFHLAIYFIILNIIGILIFTSWRFSTSPAVLSLGLVVQVVVQVLFMLSPMFIVDKKVNVFSAIGRSVKIGLSHFWRILGLLLMMALIVLVACFIVGFIFGFFSALAGAGGAANDTGGVLVGVFLALIAAVLLGIWLIPWLFNSIGVAYHRLVDQQ